MGMLSGSLGVVCALGALALGGCAGSADQTSHRAVPGTRTVGVAAVRAPTPCPALVMCIPEAQPRGRCREPAACLHPVPVVPPNPCPQLVYCSPVCPKLERVTSAPPRKPNLNPGITAVPGSPKLDPGIIARPSGPGAPGGALSCARP
jgi:hypothetical protein